MIGLAHWPKLNRDFEPESANRAIAGFVEATPTDQAVDRGPLKDQAEQKSSQAEQQQTEPQEAALGDNAGNGTTAIDPSGSDETKKRSFRLESRPLDAMDTPEAQSNSSEQPETTNGLASYGFVPSELSLDDLELVEANPDLPSASELLLEQHQRAIPFVDLVEPVDLTVIENGKSYALSDVEVAPMQVIVEQLAAEKASKDKNTAIDMTDLPQMSRHQVLDVKDYEALKASETTEEPRSAIFDDEQTKDAKDSQSRTHVSHLKEIRGSALSDKGIAESFYAYEEATRLTLLQTILSETLSEANRLGENHAKRQLLSENVAQDLVMARFGNNRIKLSEMMHDISGHRRMDMNRLLQDTGGEALVVYLYHIGMDEGQTLSMVLHGPDAVSHSYAKVAQLMTLYHQLFPEAAERIVDELFGVVNKPGFKHQTIHDNGKADAAARLRGFPSAHQPNAQMQAKPAFGRRKTDSDSA